MSTLIEEAEQFFRADDWVYAKTEDGTLVIPFEGDNGRFTCYAATREELEQFLFFAIASEDTPPHRRAAMAEFVCRANWGMILGNFEFDMDDGELRFKASADVEDVGLNPTTIRNLVYAACLTMDNYLPGIRRLNETDCTPIEALLLVEGGEE